MRELDITIEEIRKIRDADVKERLPRVARDLFILSYYNVKLDFGYKYSYENFRKYITKEICRLAEKVGITSPCCLLLCP